MMYFKLLVTLLKELSLVSDASEGVRHLLSWK